MMNNFCKVDVKEKEYNVHLDKDARENLFFSKYNENRLVGTYTATKMILPDDVVATDIDGTSERIYVSCNDKYLRMFFTDGRMLISSKTYSSGVKIVNVTYLGSNQFLIVADSGSGFWGANLPAFNLFYTPIGLFFEDSLYLANAKKLSFGPSFTTIQKTIPYELTNTITVDQECGEIVGLMSSKNNLYIICNNKILLFKHSKEGLGYSLKKIATPYLNIKKTEFCAVGDQGYFISSNILYRFYNDKVEKVDCYFNNNKLVSKNNLSVVGGVLLIPLKDDVSKQTYCYDTITGKECFVKRYSIMAKTAGFAVDGKVIRKLEFSYADNSGEQWISKPLNFGSIKNKTITEIQAEVIGRGDLRLSGDYTDKVLTLTNGFNTKKFNFNSTKFTIYTENISSDFFVKSIKIKYLE